MASDKSDSDVENTSEKLKVMVKATFLFLL